MFKFKKKEDKGDDLKFNSEELDLNVLEKEIVELVDIVEESESELSISGELNLTEEVQEKENEESPLDDVEFPTEVRQIADEFDRDFEETDDVEDHTSLDLGKELEKATQKRPYGDKIIAETLGLGEDDSLVTALRSEKIMGPAKKDDEEESLDGLDSDAVDDDRTLLVNMPSSIGDLKSDLDNEDEEGILTLTEELNDEKNTTVDTEALKNCPLIEDSTELKFKNGPSMEEVEEDDKEQFFQETKVDMSLSQILSTESLETDLKEELQEDFMADSMEIAYEETQVEMPAPDMFGIEEETVSGEVEQEIGSESVPAEEEGVDGLSGGMEEKLVEESAKGEEVNDVEQVESEVSSSSLDKEQVAEKILEDLRPEITEMVIKAVKEELPSIIEKVVMEEVTRLKKLLGENWSK